MQSRSSEILPMRPLNGNSTQREFDLTNIKNLLSHSQKNSTNRQCGANCVSGCHLFAAQPPPKLTAAQENMLRSVRALTPPTHQPRYAYLLHPLENLGEPKSYACASFSRQELGATKPEQIVCEIATGPARPTPSPPARPAPLTPSPRTSLTM